MPIPSNLVNRTSFSAADIVKDIWTISPFIHIRIHTLTINVLSTPPTATSASTTSSPTTPSAPSPCCPSPPPHPGRTSPKGVIRWKAVELETAATERGKLAIYALRSYDGWDALPQAAAIPDYPIVLRPLAPSPPKPLPPSSSSPDRCLRGLRVLEMSRVIAAPVAGRCLAAHGADVLWVTSPSLPDQPVLDKDLGRGKRTIQLDIHAPADKQTLLELLRTCDVFRGIARAGLGSPPEQVTWAINAKNLSHERKKVK
ncbi:CoA-transferase family III domain-containing protein [Trichoderma novae-zelandiae]